MLYYVRCITISNYCHNTLKLGGYKVMKTTTKNTLKLTACLLASWSIMATSAEARPNNIIPPIRPSPAGSSMGPCDCLTTVLNPNLNYQFSIVNGVCRVSQCTLSGRPSVGYGASNATICTSSAVNGVLVTNGVTVSTTVDMSVCEDHGVFPSAMPAAPL